MSINHKTADVNNNNEYKKIFSFDIGSASIGWSVIEEPVINGKTADDPGYLSADNNQDDDDCSNLQYKYFSDLNVIDIGVRMFDEPVEDKSRELKNNARREKRLARRRLRRKVRRLQAIKNLMIKHLELNEQDFDPKSTNSVFQQTIINNQTKDDNLTLFDLRVKALYHKLTKYELASALYHIAKYRGFHSTKKKDKKILAQVSDTEDLKTSKKTDKTKEEQQKVLSAVSNTIKAINEYNSQHPNQPILTQVEYLQQQYKLGNITSFHNKGGEYYNCLVREDSEFSVKKEAILVLAKQREFYPQLTAEFEKEFLRIAFYQRPIPSVIDMVKPCSLEKLSDSDRERWNILNNKHYKQLTPQEANEKDELTKKQYYLKAASRFAPTSERFLALQRLINLRIIDTNSNHHRNAEYMLTKAQIHQILDQLSSTKTAKVTYKDIRKALNIEDHMLFSILSSKYDTQQEQAQKKQADDASQDVTNEATSKKKVKTFDYKKQVINEVEKAEFMSFEGTNTLLKLFDNQYNLTNPDDRNTLDQIANIVSMFSYDHQEEAFKTYLPNLSQEHIDLILENEELFTSWTKPLKYCLTAIHKLLPILEEVEVNDTIDSKTGEIISANQPQRVEIQLAIKLAGYDTQTNTLKLDKLPNIEQAREKDDFYIPKNPVVLRVLSQLIKVYNAMVRTYGVPDQVHIELLREFKNPESSTKIHVTNRDRNELKRLKIKEKYNLSANDNSSILQYLLYDEQKNTCMYCGENITPSNFNECQIDHIIPYSISFDDSQDNKVLVHSKCNQDKGNKTPYQAFGDDQQRWQIIAHKAKESQISKKKYLNILNTKNANELADGFNSRQKNDTAYISVFFKDYIETYFNFPNKFNAKRHVYATKGGITNVLRKILNLTKIRDINDLNKKKSEYLFNKIFNSKNTPLAIKEEITHLRSTDDKTKKAYWEAKIATENYLVQYFGAALQNNDNSDDEETNEEESMTKQTTSKSAKKISLPTNQTAINWIENPEIQTILVENLMNNRFNEHLQTLNTHYIGDKHHAVDAFLVALANPALVKRFGYTTSRIDRNLQKHINKLKEQQEHASADEQSDIKQQLHEIYKLKREDNIINKIRFCLQKDDSDLAKSLNLDAFKHMNHLKQRLNELLPTINISRAPNRKLSGAIHKETLFSKKTVLDNQHTAKLKAKKSVTEITNKEVDKIIGSEQLKTTIANWLNMPKDTKPTFPIMPTNDAHKPAPVIRRVTIEYGSNPDGYYPLPHNQALVDKSSVIRIDIFQYQTEYKKQLITKYAFKPISLADILLNHQTPLTVRVAQNNDQQLKHEDGDDAHQFVCSLYNGDLIKFTYGNQKNIDVIGYYSGITASRIYLTPLQPNPYHGSAKLIYTIGQMHNLIKCDIDPLGNISYLKPQAYQPITLANIHHNQE